MSKVEKPIDEAGHREFVQYVEFLRQFYTQEEIADLVGYAPSHISNLSRGEFTLRRGFIHMMRSLAITAMVSAAKRGELVQENKSRPPSKESIYNTVQKAIEDAFK